MNKVRESFERYFNMRLATWGDASEWLKEFDNMELVPIATKEPEIESRYSQNNFLQQLTSLINCCSQEIGSSAPDFLLAEYLASCLKAFNIITTQRDKWHRKQ